jgi:hypothetical protein
VSNEQTDHHDDSIDELLSQLSRASDELRMVHGYMDEHVPKDIR